MARAYQELLERLEAIPGVREATLSAVTPLSGAGAARNVTVEGYQAQPGEIRLSPENWVAPKYFETLGTPLLAGRDFNAQDIQLIGDLIAQAPALSRTALSQRVCQQLGWLKPDGGLKEMSCRVAMLRMQEDGLIALPRARAANFDTRRAPTATPATDPQPEISHPVDQLGRLEFLTVSTQTKRDSLLWNEYIQRYHYLGYTPMSGAQLRYFVAIDGQFVALLGFGAAAWKTWGRRSFRTRRKRRASGAK